MTKQQTYRTVAWSVGGVALTSAAGLAVVLLFGMPDCWRQQSVAQSQTVQQPAAASTSGSDQLVRVKVLRPTREALKRQSTPQPAHVAPYEKTEIYSRVAGYLGAFGQIQGTDGEKRPVDIGDKVAKDQVLAKLSVPDLEQDLQQKAALVDQSQAEVEQAEAFGKAAEAMVEAAKAKPDETGAQIARYEAEVKFRKSEYDRYVALVKERAVSREVEDEKLSLYRATQASLTAAKAALATDHANVRVEQAKFAKSKADVISAQARLKVAQANLEQSVIMLNFATIKAPYDGVITRRLVDTGAFVQSAATGKAEPLFTLARVDRLRIIADFPEAEASLVKLGQAATLQVNASRGQQLKGKVVRFADALDSGTRTMRTEVELDGPAMSLRPGTFGSVTIMFADSSNALILPTSALLTDGAKTAVMIVKDGRAHRQAVDVGYADGVRTQIARGLTGEEQVIADGKNTVREGQLVEIAK